MIPFPTRPEIRGTFGVFAAHGAAGERAGVAWLREDRALVSVLRDMGLPGDVLLPDALQAKVEASRAPWQAAVAAAAA